MDIPDDVKDCLAHYADAYPGDRLLQISPPGLTELDLGSKRLLRINLNDSFDPVNDLASIGRVDLAVVVDAPFELDRVKTRQLLAYLRNYTSSATIAAFNSDVLRHNSTWSVSEFLGLGFRRVPEARRLASAYWIYRYDIHDYKITPDWLNSRYWANPGEWDRHRW